MFSVVCDKDIKPGEKIYLDTSHFLPFTRFLPKKIEKGANKGGNKNQKGKGGNFNRGGKGGRGQQRGGGGYRPPRGGSSGGYRPPRKQGK